ncbi:lytic transglycosylase domain-containing protein [Clostridium felsineum]|uniref:lytic transglycosylase domain-containing protein n=1 Tax=Clostridium felsineum TaxID=36839 RepID=UPI00098CBACE|nr:lytic transglycosylase domain-containing protein [Clostridium felsineum]URZ15701.1 Soluble lytic murein transglycosylase [Clostridium felsineum DSM 794]
MKSKSKIFIFIIIIIALIVALNTRNILKHFYPVRYVSYIEKYSKENNLDPYFVMAVVRVESNFNASARSNKDAYGLMQITPETAEWAAEKMGLTGFKVEDLTDPEINIKIGCWYLKDLSNEFGGDWTLILAAYNGGRGNVKKWLNNKKNSKDGKTLHYIPYGETNKYVKKVMMDYKVYKRLYENN